MAIVRLDGRTVRDWPSFHRESRIRFGFPDFYGNNLDAWIDCLSTLRDGDGMTAVRLAPDETLRIEVTHSDALRRHAPGILDALQEAVEAVNGRYAENREKPALELYLD
jgi:RNAse (barnase) inhibitor barstar